MGLDMYLKASRYVGGWNHTATDERAQFSAVLTALGLTPGHVAKSSPSVTVDVSVAYWRKANAIHRWFVDNIQDGEDECKAHYVPREKLQELHDLAKYALDNKDATKLPPMAGFFFGSTEIDEGYWQDLKDTVEQLGKVLTAPEFEKYDFEYRSSW